MHLDFSSLIVFNRSASWRKLLPEHGTTGQALVKLSDGEGDVGWGAGGGTGAISIDGGTPSTVFDLSTVIDGGGP